MNELTATQHAQSQGRIKRQMISQKYAVPISDLVLDRSSLLMEQMMDRITDKMARDIDWNTNPVVKIKTYGDRIKLDHIPREKFYSQTKPFSRTMNTHTVWPLKPDSAKNATTEIELTFKDGGFV